MSIWGVTSGLPVALPSLLQATESPAQKTRTKKRLKKKATQPPPPPDTYVPPAPAETKVDLAKKHFKAGRKHYENGEYGAALDEFKKAYDLIHILDFQYNIGVCYEKLGAHDKAIEALQLYVDGNPDKEEKEETEARIAWIRIQMKKQRKKEEPAVQAVAAVPPPEEQAPPPQSTKPPDPKVAVRRKPKAKIHVPSEKSWQITDQEEPPASPPAVAAVPPPVEKGESVPVLTAPPPPAEDRYIPPSSTVTETIGVTAKSSTQRPIPYRTLMWTSVGLSSASLIAGLVGHFEARSKQAEHSEEVDSLVESRDIIGPKGSRDFRNQETADRYGPRLNELEASKNRYRTVAWTGFIGSAVFLGLGGAFYWFDKKQVRLLGTPLPRGGAATLEGGF